MVGTGWAGRFGRTLAVATLLVPVILMMAQSEADAAVKWKPYKVKYSITKNFASKPLHGCFRVTLSGTMKVKGKPFTRVGIWQWKDAKLVNPKMTVRSYNHCAKKGRKAKKYSKVEMTQAWYHWTCHTSASISPGFPWAIQVTPTIDCGNMKTAERFTSPDGSSAKFTQNNTGNPVNWKKREIGVRACLFAQTTLVAYKGDTSDSSVIEAYHVCKNIPT